MRRPAMELESGSRRVDERDGGGVGARVPSARIELVGRGPVSGRICASIAESRHTRSGSSTHVRRHALLNARALLGILHRVPHDLGCDGHMGAPAVSRARKEVRLRPHPPVERAQRRQQGGTQRDVAITPALAAFDAEHHPLTVDVADIELTELRPPQTGPVQRQQQRPVPVVQVLRPGDEALDFFWAQHDGNRSRCLGYCRSSYTSRRGNTWRQKNRSAHVGDHGATEMRPSCRRERCHQGCDT